MECNDEDFDRIFNIIDVNQTGEIEWEEYLEVMVKLFAFENVFTLFNKCNFI